MCTGAGWRKGSQLERSARQEYIFDASSALVTSANATFSGLRLNWECGLATTDTRIVTQLARSLLRGLGADRPPHPMGIEELEALRAPLAIIKASLPKPSRVPREKTPATAPDAVFPIADEDAFLAGFTGWLRLTLEGVLTMPKASFRLEDLLSVCAPVAARQYPKNRHVPDKLRQQLQLLRDRGIVDFLGHGEYRCTLETS